MPPLPLDTPAPPTIAALASGWAPSRRALIRLSGHHLPTLLHALVRPVPAHPWRIARASLFIPPASTDFPHPLPVPILITRSDPPRSYTGEPCAEIILPGNPLLIERVLAAITALPGVREAQPGEFSARAYLNGKLSIDQAEGIAATIAASTDAQLAAADDLLRGQSGRTYRRWADELATLLALVEAGIDFTDQEDVVPISPADLHARVQALLAAISAHTGATTGDEHPDHQPRAVLVGPPNAGKSTLFNALLGRRRAVASPIAGTTRDALAEALDLSAESPGLTTPTITLIDLPGLDPSLTGAIDQAAQSRAHDEIARADILLHCHPVHSSARRGAAGGSAAAHAPPSHPQSHIHLTTKSDLPSAHPPDPNAIPISALDGWNLPTLRRALADAAWSRGAGGAGGTGGTGGDRPFLLPRHRRALALTAAHLRAAASTLDPTARALAHPETLATELRAALDTLSELTGHISPDDILGRVFATFCIGK